MAVKRCKASINVVRAAEKRICNVFSNGLPVYMSFSGGKDSLVLAQLVASLIQRGMIDARQLTVQFIDEEAIFPCIERTTFEWRKKFMLLGAKFEWFCIEVRHFNCFNMLSEDESFICWDREKEAVWVRRPPPFAIRSHPLLRPRRDTYQDFMTRLCVDGLTITGIRAAESIQRLQSISIIMSSGRGMTPRRQIFPVYDWSNNDVWLYLLEQHVEIPEIYLYLWQSGTGKGQLRVSQFFSSDTARSLVQMNEYYPDLMERVIRREPNAYLAALYWDSEMFGRRTRARRELEKDDAVDYRAKVIALLNDIDKNFHGEHQKVIALHYRKFFIGASTIITDKECRKLYDALMRGDPKLRALRAMYQTVYGRYVTDAKTERAAKA